MAHYNVLALDFDRCTLSETEENTLKEAQERAREFMKDTELLKAGAMSAVVRNAKGQCVYDAFAPNDAPAVVFALKLEQARVVLTKAQNALGADLRGHSVTDLLADNFDWPLDECRNIANQLGA